MRARRSRRGAGLAAVLAAATLLTTGCLSATTAGVLPGESGGGDQGRTGPGVTEDSIKIAVINSDLGQVSEQLGLVTPDRGDPIAQIGALQTYVNANGGMGGREVELVVKTVNASLDSPETEEATCNEITQDDQAFAAVLTGQFFKNARECYAAADTIMVDQTLAPQGRDTYEALAPYLWAPSFPPYEELTSALMKTLADRDFFAGATNIGVVAPDNDINKAVFEDIVLPAAADQGAPTPKAYWIDTTDIGTLNQGLAQAAIAMKTDNISHVAFLGGERIASFFMTAASLTDFTARYALTTFDSPVFLTANPATVPQAGLPNSIGIGFNQGSDVANAQYAGFPRTDAEKRCINDVYTPAGITFAGVGEARDALQYCDSILFLKATIDSVSGSLNATSFGEAAAGLGSEFVASSGFSTLLEDGRWAGGASYREFAYLDACKCYDYVADPVSFGGNET